MPGARSCRSVGFLATPVKPWWSVSSKTALRIQKSIKIFRQFHQWVCWHAHQMSNKCVFLQKFLTCIHLYPMYFKVLMSAHDKFQENGVMRLSNEDEYPSKWCFFILDHKQRIAATWCLFFANILVLTLLQLTLRTSAQETTNVQLLSTLLKVTHNDIQVGSSVKNWQIK